MKKALLLLTVLSLPTLLTGCGDSDHARKEQCTKLQNEMTDQMVGKSERTFKEIKADWDELQCKRTDVIQG
ncbi:hypothetical protein J7I01_002713 [Vibrio parahaemolyticus]|nr:hypothetical protein [Vibrio parahaemolyticus]